MDLLLGGHLVVCGLATPVFGADARVVWTFFEDPANTFAPRLRIPGVKKLKRIPLSVLAAALAGGLLLSLLARVRPLRLEQ